jgi:hypothetical protein
VTCCYWDGSTRGFIANVLANSTCLKDASCGADDTQVRDRLHSRNRAAAD